MYQRTYAKKLPRGVAGTLATVDLILPEIREGRKSPNVLRFAHRAIERVPERNYWGEIEAVHEAVKRGLRFTRDPVGIEKITSADALARGILARETVFADCDEFVILEGAALEAIGHQVRPKIIGSAPGQFRHIYLEVQFGGRWVPLDSTMKAQPAGFEVAHRYGRSFGDPGGLGWVQALVQAAVEVGTEVYGQERAASIASKTSRHGFARQMALLKAEAENARESEKNQMKPLDVLLQQSREQSKVALARIAAEERIARLAYAKPSPLTPTRAAPGAGQGVIVRTAPGGVPLWGWAAAGLGLTAVVVMVAKR